ncbi:MAG: tagatose 1,6-diphosphate aldolase [Candidatus Bipolaricaulia bacterium]
MKRTPGKARGLARIGDGDGRIAAVATDQRPPLFNLVADKLDMSIKDTGPRASEIKGLLAETLAHHATGLLVDPYYGFCRAMPHLPPETGLMMTLEHHVFATDTNGFRKSDWIPDWSAEQAVRYGADGLKLLAWYRSDAPQAVLDHQHRFVERVGAACRQVDRPFVYEVLPYQLASESDEAYVEALPELMRRCMLDFSDERYGVDLYKLGFPARAKAVEEWGGSHYPLADMEAIMRETTERLPAPWVLLSGGLDSETFIQAFRSAVDCGARGYLAGRAVWAEAMDAYPDLEACRGRLQAQSVEVLDQLNQTLESLPAQTVDIDCDLEDNARVEVRPESDY